MQPFWILSYFVLSAHAPPASAAVTPSVATPCPAPLPQEEKVCVTEFEENARAAKPRDARFRGSTLHFIFCAVTAPSHIPHQQPPNHHPVLHTLSAHRTPLPLDAFSPGAGSRPRRTRASVLEVPRRSPLLSSCTAALGRLLGALLIRECRRAPSGSRARG